MEQDSAPTPEPPDDQAGEKPDGCGSIILKLIAGAAVLLFVAVALVFGLCFLG